MDSLIPQRVLFGGDAPIEIASLLERAMQSYADGAQAEDLLWQAHHQAPNALPVYFSLYKYYFYKGNLEQAELAARMALVAAAMQGGFDSVPRTFLSVQPEGAGVHPAAPRRFR